MRDLRLIGLCVEAITAHKERQKLEAESAGVGWTDTDHVFATTAGTPIEPDNLRRGWYPLRSAIGAVGTRFHDLRHSCVTMLLDLGVPPHIVRDIVGRLSGSWTSALSAEDTKTPTGVSASRGL